MLQRPNLSLNADASRALACRPLCANLLCSLGSNEHRKAAGGGGEGHGLLR